MFEVIVAFALCTALIYAGCACITSVRWLWKKVSP